MFSRANRTDLKPTPKSSAPSIISVDLRITGDVITVGDIQVDGLVEGDVQSRSIVVGVEAQVRGAITAESARITGTVLGSIRAGSVILDGTAKVTGDIVTGNLSIEAGAFFEGKVERTTPGVAEAKPQPAKLSLASSAPLRQQQQQTAEPLASPSAASA